jgi:hypothetical protein
MYIVLSNDVGKDSGCEFRAVFYHDGRRELWGDVHIYNILQDGFNFYFSGKVWQKDAMITFRETHADTLSTTLEGAMKRCRKESHNQVYRAAYLPGILSYKKIWDAFTVGPHGIHCEDSLCGIFSSRS